ncbi:hypothetical protein J6590_053911 [Homalodisca vitripennis]|nr:hypothetical protein J6590_053911 [Homalodisca vitripennis]
MEGQFLVRQIYEDEITYNLVGAASTVDKESLDKQLCLSGSTENTRDLLHRWIEKVKSLAAILGSSKRKREASPACV